MKALRVVHRCFLNHQGRCFSTADSTSRQGQFQMSARLVHRAICIVLPFIAFVARAQSGAYRYQLDTRSGQPRYAGQIPDCTGSAGPCYGVQADSAGRLSQLTYYENGNVIKRAIYNYLGASRLANEIDFYRGGELVNKTYLERNSQGDITKYTYRTAQGDLSATLTRTYSGNQVDFSRYNADGKATHSYTTFYAPNGVAIRTVHYPDDHTRIEEMLDPTTGQSTSKKQFEADTLAVETRFSYDANGSLLREDHYDPRGRWYGADEYKDGLMSRRLYKFPDGNSQESRISYDTKRFIAESRFYHNDRLICTFKYDLFPNGGIKRTLAIGPGGDLYAEYPDHLVYEVNQDGTAIEEIKGAVIYKKTNWW